MGVINCIEALIEGKAIKQETGDALLDLFRNLRKTSDKGNSPEISDAIAKDKMVEIIEGVVQRQKLLATLRVNRTRQISTEMAQHPKGMATGALTHLVRDLDADTVAPWTNVEMTSRTFLGIAHGLFADGIKALGPRKAGLDRRKTNQKLILRELFGEDTGDATAKAGAKAFTEAADFLRKQFNNYGGNMAERADWGLPQSHDSVKVGAVSKDEWIDFILPRLDREKMLDFDTGQPLSDARLVGLLETTYDRIRTNGMVDMKPGKRRGGTAIADRHQDHRFISFANPKAWFEYSERFGTGGDVYGVMTNHLEVMAKDAAMLKELGPDPDAMVRFMVDTIRKDAAVNGKNIPHIKIRNLENNYKVLTDRINDNAQEPVSMFMAGTRNVLTAAQLGSAFLSAVTDIGFAKVTAKFNGIPTMKVMGSYFKQMNPFSDADRMLAIQSSLVAESATSVALAQKRFFGDVLGPRITELFSDVVLRATLLTPHTQSMRHAFGMEFFGMLARNKNVSFDALEPPVQASFARYGITPDDWEVIRKANTAKFKGAEFIDVRELAKIGDGELAFKMNQMVLTEMDFAVPMPGVRERSIVTGGTNPGTIIGELDRSVAMYKSFPITVANTHLMRGVNMANNGDKIQAGKYLGSLFIATTVMGAVAVQMKNISKGKDPISMNPENEDGRKFWQAAMLQGGGLGIFGDFAFADQNRFGSGPAMTFAGPVAALVDDVTKFSIGNLQEVAAGEETKAGRELTQLTKKYFPGSNAWYARLAFERLVIDQMQQQLDRKASSSFKSRERFAKQQFGQQYWWRPGSLTPDRFPDVEAVLEE
ncbi:MAG: hypothetical protein ACR2PR_06025 [Pseudohongiellaceae bacterium]